MLCCQPASSERVSYRSSYWVWDVDSKKIMKWEDILNKQDEVEGAANTQLKAMNAWPTRHEPRPRHVPLIIPFWSTTTSDTCPRTNHTWICTAHFTRHMKTAVSGALSKPYTYIVSSYNCINHHITILVSEDVPQNAEFGPNHTQRLWLHNASSISKQAKAPSC